MVTLFSKPNCPQCSQTKTMLANASIGYNEVDLTRDPAAMRMVMGMGYRSAPVVLTEEGRHWAGYQPSELRRLAHSASEDVWDSM